MPSFGSGQRILIGAGCFADAEAAFWLLERIERQLPLELGGLLVDEGLITDFVRSPMQRVVTSGGDLVDLPSAEQARALVESDARAFQRMLSSTARTRAVKWSFEKRSGDLIRHIFDAAQQWDILLLGRRAIHKRAGQVVFVSDHSYRSERAEKIARNLAEAVKTNHVTLSILREQTERNTEDASFIFENDEPGLLSRLSRMNAAAVVVDLAAGHRWSRHLIRQLLEAARCPLVILGPEIASELTENSATVRETSKSNKTGLWMSKPIFGTLAFKC